MDQDPHGSALFCLFKLLDPDPNQCEMQDPDLHQSEKVEVLEGLPSSPPSV
jgi:hypothetical protein